MPRETGLPWWDPDYHEQVKLSIYIYQDVQTNILPNSSYYYSTSEHTVTTSGEATPITLNGGDISGLDLYVDTGWLLTGQIHLPEGGYIEDGEVNVNISLQDEDGRYVGSNGSGTVGPDGGSYFITVPQGGGHLPCSAPAYGFPSRRGIQQHLLGGQPDSGPVLITGNTSGWTLPWSKPGL